MPSVARRSGMRRPTMSSPLTRPFAAPVIRANATVAVAPSCSTTIAYGGDRADREIETIHRERDRDADREHWQKRALRRLETTKQVLRTLIDDSIDVRRLDIVHPK
jgi:hypothetical protein